MDQKRASSRRAAALKYDPETDDVPVMTAFGEGFMADRIIERAVEHGVPVMPDPDLASMLSKMSVGDEIPPELYEVVARVLLFVSKLDSDYGKRIQNARASRRSAPE